MIKRHTMTGLSLIELMVALTISAILIFGATQVYVDSRATYNVNETVSRMQENARYAMSVIEPDVRMANFWGLVKTASLVTGQALQTAAVSSIASNAEANYCGNNMTVDLNSTIWGDNNGFVLTRNPPLSANCNTVAGTGFVSNPVLSSDTLTIRRASAVANVDGAGNPVSTNHVVQICSTRIGARLISDGSSCGTAPVAQNNNLIVNAYYVSNSSTQSATTPSLRRKALTTVANVIRYADQEIIPGVEDMQVQYGVDTTGLNGFATRYVNADMLAGLPAGTAVVSVRVWLMVRADQPETGFIDPRTYTYADRAAANGNVSNLNLASSGTKAFQPSLDTSTAPTSVKRYRRILVCRTFQIRNSFGT